MSIEHCPGEENLFADLLSRNPVEEVTEDLSHPERLLPPEQHYTPPLPDEETDAAVCAVESRTLLEEIRNAQQSDPHHTKLATRYLDLIRRTELTGEEQQFINLYNVIDGTLWKYDRPEGRSTAPCKILVPQSVVGRVLYDCHDSEYAGHPGAEETVRAISEFHYWSKMRDEVRDYVKRCFLCACCKSSNTAAAKTQHPHRPKKPWDTISIDLMDPYPRSSKGRRFILVAMDMFSRWVEAFSIGSSEVSRVIRLMEEEVFARWGYPRAILSDNGPQFV